MLSQIFLPHEDESLSQECNDLILTLPREKGLHDMLQYQGFWCHVEILRGIISFQKHFQAQDSDVFLVSTPKSGTTWLKAIMFTLLNRKRFPVMENYNHPLLTRNPHDLVPFLESQVYANNQILDISSYHSPRLFSTHIPYDSLPESMKNGKLVYLCRNPKDALVSLSHFSNKLKPQEMRTDSIGEDFEMFCKGVTMFGPFWDHVLEYWKQSKENPDRILFLKYEDMKEQPGVNLRRLAEFLDCPFSADEEESGLVDAILKLCSFGNLTSLEVNKTGISAQFGIEFNFFFHRGKVGDWKNYLDTEMVEKIDRITEEKFRGSGLVL